jgi:hypothetical protein
MTCTDRELRFGFRRAAPAVFSLVLAVPLGAAIDVRPAEAAASATAGPERIPDLLAYRLLLQALAAGGDPSTVLGDDFTAAEAVTLQSLSRDFVGELARWESAGARIDRGRSPDRSRQLLRDRLTTSFVRSLRARVDRDTFRKLRRLCRSGVKRNITGIPRSGLN